MLEEVKDSLNTTAGVGRVGSNPQSSTEDHQGDEGWDWKAVDGDENGVICTSQDSHAPSNILHGFPCHYDHDGSSSSGGGSSGGMDPRLFVTICDEPGHTNKRMRMSERETVRGPSTSALTTAFETGLSQVQSRLEGLSRSWSSNPKVVDEVKNDIIQVFRQAQSLPLPGMVEKCCHALHLPTRGPQLLSRLCDAISAPDITTSTCEAFVSHALFPYVSQLVTSACRTFSTGLAELAHQRPRVIIEKMAVPLLCRGRDHVGSSQCELFCRLVKQGSIPMVSGWVSGDGNMTY